MNAVVYFPHMTAAPTGIWWEEPDQASPENAYIGPTAAVDSATGRDLMSSKVDDVSWPEYFQQLAARTPYFGNWETYTLPDNADPKAFLIHLNTIAARKIKNVR